MIYVSKTLEETSKIAKTFLDTLSFEDIATVVAFGGDLGAGKTTFIQLLAKEMEVGDVITSPTFVIQKTYKAHKYFDNLVHIDAYRLASGDDILKLRFSEVLAIPKTLVCVEWPENISSAIPKDSIKIECKFIDETTHSYEF